MQKRNPAVLMGVGRVTKQAEKMGLSDSQYLRMLITNVPGITRKSVRNWNA